MSDKTNNLDDTISMTVRLHALQSEHLPNNKEDRETLIKFGLSVLPYRICNIAELPNPCKSVVRLSISMSMIKIIDQLASQAGNMDTRIILRAAVHYGLADSYSLGYSKEYRQKISMLNNAKEKPIDITTGLLFDA